MSLATMQSTLYTLSLYTDHDVKVVVAARPRYKKRTEVHNDKEWSGQTSAPNSQIMVDINYHPYPCTTGQNSEEGGN